PSQESREDGRDGPRVRRPRAGKYRGTTTGRTAADGAQSSDAFPCPGNLDPWRSESRRMPSERSHSAWENPRGDQVGSPGSLGSPQRGPDLQPAWHGLLFQAKHSRCGWPRNGEHSESKRLPVPLATNWPEKLRDLSGVRIAPDSAQGKP